MSCTLSLTYCGWLSEVQHQLICGKHPMFYRGSTFQGAAGWEPLPNSTFQGFHCADGGACDRRIEPQQDVS